MYLNISRRYQRRLPASAGLDFL